ncbi:uncharacterized protein CFAP97D2 [Osmerus mordax]|uniref:uncharacterized protein CFAP97D2 n=1 Tax=Osmerus mordax TaxID=8014 RepID=UPI00350F079E
MHKAYQPLQPATNRHLQQRWDQSAYQQHRDKVYAARPMVDTKGMKAPAHVQLKLKKLQVHEECQAVIERDNRLLASRLSDIVRSRGLVDHRNHYAERSLNAEKRRDELLHVTNQNQAIYQRITARQSEYRRQLWLDDWKREERRREDIARYPRGVQHQQRSRRRVKFSSIGDTSEPSEASPSDPPQ